MQLWARSNNFPTKKEVHAPRVYLLYLYIHILIFYISVFSSAPESEFLFDFICKEFDQFSEIRPVMENDAGTFFEEVAAVALPENIADGPEVFFDGRSGSAVVFADFGIDLIKNVAQTAFIFNDEIDGVFQIRIAFIGFRNSCVKQDFTYRLFDFFHFIDTDR